MFLAVGCMLVILSYSIQNNKGLDKCHPIIIIIVCKNFFSEYVYQQCTSNVEFVSIHINVCIACFQSYIHGSSQAQFVAETHIVIILSILLLQTKIFILAALGKGGRKGKH